MLALLSVLAMPLAAQDYKIAIIGLVHSHVWGHLETMARQEHARFAGIAEPNAELVEYAKTRGAGNVKFYSDYRQLLSEAKPDIVWAFVENNRHLEIVQACAPKGIHVMFEKPLASTYKDALAIQALAKKHNIQILTNYQMAWWPSQYAAKQEIEAGAAGQVWRLRGVVGHGGPGSEGAGSKFFFEWLTDPVKNGAGALMDFGCYNALWSLWYLGKPESVYAQVNHLRPERFPKVEDNATIVLKHAKGVGIYEGSWDLPRSLQDLEVFGLKGSVYMKRDGVEVRQGGTTKQVNLAPLAKEKSGPIPYMIHCLRTKTPVEGLTAIDINVQVNEIIEAALRSVKTGKAVKLPLQ